MRYINPRLIMILILMTLQEFTWVDILA